MSNIIELCAKQDKNGRRKFKAVLHEVFPDSCIGEDGLGTIYQDNGITWIEEYCNKALPTIEGMSIRVQFLDDERSQIYGHGETDLAGEKIAGLPLFENATVVGHFTKGYITDIDNKRVCVGEGILDEMCYPNFVQWLEEQVQDKNSVFGSIEIFKAPNNSGIIYLKEHEGNEIGRIPTEYIYSGFAMLDCCVPADKSSKLLELNQKMEVEKMNEELIKQLNSTIKTGIADSLDKSKEYEAKIAELNSIVDKKDTEVETLNQQIKELSEALANLKSEQETAWAERDILEKELAELRAAKRVTELNEALSQFTEDELKYAEEDISKFKNDPVNSGVEINSIVNCIKVNSYDAKKKKDMAVAKNVSEINSNQASGIASMFSIIDVPADENTETLDMNDIFA